MDLNFSIPGYEALRRLRGERAALEWFHGRIPRDAPFAVSIYAHPEGADELLWDALPAEPTGKDSEWVWLARAAACVRASTPDPARCTPVMQYYREPDAGFAGTLGRHLLGLASLDEVAVVAKDQRQRCEAAYWLGFAAEHRGDTPQAAAWYRLAVELGEYHWQPFRLAYNKLFAWHSWGKSLARIAAEGPPKRSALPFSA